MTSLFFVMLVIGVLIFTISVFLKRCGEISIDEPLNVYEEYQYLGKERLKYAVYQQEHDCFFVYETDGKSLSFVERVELDPKEYFYDIPSASFQKLEMLKIDVSSDGNTTTVETGDERRLIIRYTGLKYDTNMLLSSTMCTDGTLYPMTNKLYKTLINAPSSNSSSVNNIEELYASCKDNKFKLHRCNEGEYFSSGECRQMVGVEPLAIAPSTFPHTDSSFVQVVNQRITIVSCTNGVDSTGVACNDVECIEKNGVNYVDAPYQSSFGPALRPTARKSTLCQDGHIVSSTDCGAVPYITTIEFINADDEIEKSIRTLHPKKIYSKRNERCVNVRGNFLAAKEFDVSVYYRAFRGAITVSLTKKEKPLFRQSMTAVENGLFVPSLESPKVFFVKNSQGKVFRQTTEVAAIVYRNGIYSTKIRDLSEIKVQTPLPYFVIVKTSDKHWCTVMGNTIIDLISQDDTNSQTEDEFITELMKSPEDDFHHTPLMIRYIKEKQSEQLIGHGVKYQNTCTLYGIDFSYPDLETWRSNWRSIFGVTETVKSRSKRV